MQNTHPTQQLVNEMAMMTDAARQQVQNEWDRLDRMVRVIWNLTPRELCRLSTVRAGQLTENMKVAIGMRVEEATVFSHDNFDVPHYRGNAFYEYMERNPVYGPVIAPLTAEYGSDDIPF